MGVDNSSENLDLRSCKVSFKTDCDGDSLAICYGSMSCPYRKVVRDCDGDFVEICQKY